MARWLLRTLLAAFLLGSTTLAQQRLVVNGVPVSGLTTKLVPGTAYVQAETFAEALGATYRFDPQTGLFLDAGGRYLSLKSFVDPAQALQASDALMVDGRALSGPGAVSRGNVAYLPVKSVVAALGGQTAYLSDHETVVVVFPRPQLQGLEPPAVWGSFERFVLTFDAPVSLEPLYETSLRMVRFRFPRASLADPLLARQVLSGSRFSAAAFIPENEYLDFNLTLRAGNDYSFFSEPFGEGERVVIDVFRDEREVQGARPSVHLAVTPETTPLGERLRTRLLQEGIEVSVSAVSSPEAAQRSGFAAPFFLVLQRAPLLTGRFNLYYLGDSGLPSLRAPLRQASLNTALSTQGRARLTGLTPDLRLGERAAQRLAAGLEDAAGLRRESVMAAPLLALSGAAGRGLLLELSPEDLADPALVDALATSFAALLSEL